MFATTTRTALDRLVDAIRLLTAFAALGLAGCSEEAPVTDHTWRPAGELLTSAPYDWPFKGSKADVHLVCQSPLCAHQTFASAVAAAKDGDQISIMPGRYDDCIHTRGKSLFIRSGAHLSEPAPILTKACNGKAAIVADGRWLVVVGIDIQGIEVADRNGACIRFEGQRKSLDAYLAGVRCTDSENGLLGSLGRGRLVLFRTAFARNGGNGGQAHSLYITSARDINLTDSIIAATRGKGHMIKSGADRLYVRRSVLAGLDGDHSRVIDAYAGGLIVVRDSVLQIGPNSDNADFIGLNHEADRNKTKREQLLWVEDSYLVSDRGRLKSAKLVSGACTGACGAQNIVAIGKMSLNKLNKSVSGLKAYSSREAAGLEKYSQTLESLPNPLIYAKDISDVLPAPLVTGIPLP